MDEIKRFYPASLKGNMFLQHMLKEYLQTMILNRIFKSSHSDKLVFMGGTSLRFCYGLDRFSEDLDFDLFEHSKKNLRSVFDDIVRHIRKEGFRCEVEHNYKDTDNFCRIIFPDAAREFKLNDSRKKIWIKIDIQKNRTSYPVEKQIINRFGFYFPVSIPSRNILFSMKAVALTQRVKAHDMYDFSFLSESALLDIAYISKNLQFFGVRLTGPDHLKELILSPEKKIDLNEKVHEISLFLMNKEHSERVTSFYEYFRGIDFRKMAVSANQA